MAVNIHAAKQKVTHFIQQVPFSEEEKAAWLKGLEDNDVSETLLDELRDKLLAIPPENFSSDWMRAKFTADLATLARQWRMSTASRQFKHGR